MIPARFYVLGAAFLAVFGLGFLSAWKVQGSRLEKARTQAATVVAQHEAAVQRAEAMVQEAEARAARVTAEAEARTAQVITQIRTVTKEVVREVPTYITPATDAGYPLPVGLVCIHDAAASGENIPSPGPCDTPGASSDVKASEAAAVIAENYGACRECCERVRQWQLWYDQLRKEWNGD
jgi:hypothetical protein